MLALSHDGSPSPLAWPATVFTLVKWMLSSATLAVTCLGTARWLWTRTRHTARPTDGN